MNRNENSALPALPLVDIYIDGECEPNPGAGGYGVVLLHPKKRAEARGGFRKTTNNRMEILPRSGA
jgi:ribonuclease HI